MNEAREQGCHITLDTYPYLPGCTTLASLLPSWASSGGPVETLTRLSDSVLREKIRHAVEVTGCDGGHGIPTNWSTIQVSHITRGARLKALSLQVGSTTHPDLASYSNRTIQQLAEDLDQLPIDVFFDILIKDRLATSCLMHIGNEENVREILMHEQHCAGSDAILHGTHTHPRVSWILPD